MFIDDKFFFFFIIKLKLIVKDKLNFNFQDLKIIINDLIIKFLIK